MAASRSQSELSSRVGSVKRVAWPIATTLALAGFYFITAPKTSSSHDPLTNALTAWSIGTRLTFVLAEHAPFLSEGTPLGVVGIVAGTKGPVGVYPLGAAFQAAPFYALAGGELRTVEVTAQNQVVSFGIPPLWPAALASATVSAALVTVVFFTLSKLGSRGEVLAGAAVLAFGTSTWAISSQALWQHGPATLWIAAVCLLADRRTLSASFAWMPAILTRPLALSISGGLHFYEYLAQRNLRKLILPIVGSVTGVALLLVLNHRVFGTLVLARRIRAITNAATTYVGRGLLGLEHFSGSLRRRAGLIRDFAFPPGPCPRVGPGLENGTLCG